MHELRAAQLYFELLIIKAPFERHTSIGQIKDCHRMNVLFTGSIYAETV